MKRHLIYPLLIVFLIAPAGFIAPAAAGARAVPTLVSTGWLARHLGEPDLVVIDVRTASNYDFAHIPGAVSLPYYSGCRVISTAKMCYVTPPPTAFSAAMRAIGVNRSSYIVIYDDGNTASDATKGTSAVWVMQSMGVRKVSYLDGGFTKWTFEGRKVTRAKPSPTPGNFMARPDRSIVATLSGVVYNLKTHKAIFIDARPAEQHFGVDKEASVPRYGHIPGSLSFPATYMTNARSDRAPATIKSRRQLAAMARGIGLTPDKDHPIIVYCNSGQFAGLGYLVLHELLGYRHVRVFSGSMLEYASNEKLPLTRFEWGFVGPVARGPAVMARAAQAHLVSVDWLARNLKAPHLAVLDVGAFTRYEKEHIPGAARAFGPWQRKNAQFVGYMMPSVPAVIRMLRSFGVNNDSFVVIYDDGTTAHDTAMSARALWTLEALGHDRVAILDGGFEAWKQKKEPVTSRPSVPRPGDFTGRLEKGKLATLADVKRDLRSSGVVFVDNRSPNEDFGFEKKSYIVRYGHLPGSRLWPAGFMTIGGIKFSPSYMRPREELADAVRGVGIPANRNAEIITYSDQGTDAALGYFVLHDLMGYKNVRLFDGSILEAAADMSVPMEKNGWGYKRR